MIRDTSVSFVNDSPSRPTYPLRFALIGTAALVAALSSSAKADLIIDQPDGYAVRSQGSVSLGARVTIDGSLGAAGSASFGAGSVVTGDVSTGTPYTWFRPDVGTIPPWGSTNINVARDRSLALDPGAYGKFTSGTGASLLLSAGEYVFRSFDLARAGTVIADTSAGDVTLYVGEMLKGAAQVRFETIGPGTLFIVTGGSASFGNDARLTASLYSLGAQSFSSRTLLTGTTWSGGSISIGADSTFTYASIPTPGAVALLALAGVYGRRRRR